MSPTIGLYRKQIEDLSANNDRCKQIFEKFLKSKEWSSDDWEHLLRTTGQSLLDPQLTVLLGTHLRPWILELLRRAQFAASKAMNTGGGLELHIALCLALSKLITVSNDVERFALNYFQKFPAPYEKQKNDPVEPSPKRKKKQNLNFVATDRDVIRATYDLLCHMGQDLIHVWKWSDLLAYVTHGIEEIRWLACNCISILSKMTEVEKETLIKKYVTPEVHHKYCIENGMSQHAALPVILTEGDNIEEIPAARHIAVVGGVSLSIYNKKTVTAGHLVTVSSTKRNLEGVAIAVSQGHPVLIEGVVGSGKTSVVEHLAAVTGRTSAPHLTKIQLGDQTDSKTLLGTYCCTQVPGEFIWRPGSLTQAVMKGYWLLLEDLDYAPMDVISILVPLLESRTLPVPGYGNVRAHPAFQLLATRRTLGGSKIVSGCTKLLDKLWTKVTLETLSRSELEHLISEKWPNLESITERLTAIYLMLSAGQHDDDMIIDNMSNIPDMAAVKLSGRLVSTRDLMKWCSRVNAHIDSSENIATSAFQEALDCFCAAVPSLNTRHTFALHIGSYMNCARAEVEYYCTKYKPEIFHDASSLKIGQRGNLPKMNVNALSIGRSKNFTFSFTRPASLLLERISVAITNHEPVLLVGETGTGKTSTVQYLAHQTKHKLRVINMNQQSDSTDLLGGFKPVEMKTIVAPLRQEFEDLFAATFSSSKNSKFLKHIMVCYVNQRWQDLFTLMGHTQEKALTKLDTKDEDVQEEGQMTIAENKDLSNRWKKMRIKITNLKEQVEHAQSALAFAFIEGALVKAVQEGEWVLLDEINLSSAETLECLSGLLESDSGSLVLLERGDSKPVTRHPDFRLFACMNPATDVGKKELPAGIRNRFTEFYMDELEDNLDIMILINDYLNKLGPSSQQVQGIKDFYKKVKKRAVSSLTDGTGHKPHFSLRTLCRALAVAAKNPCQTMRRSLFEAFCLSFLTQLDRSSHPVVVSLILTHVMGLETSEAAVSKKKMPLDPIPSPSTGKFINIEGFWVSQGDQEPDATQNYILTDTVKKNLHDLVRVVSIGHFPVLLQGETSVGKTSLITYLSRLTGNSCVRINNHEHTDLQEYIGSYAPDENGKLVFKEGILVKAMRNGHWIILDELNLAPTDVLEALNRLLDDNRELFIPETQETVRAHKHFMLFATQNPPGLYGGRKVLSRAFRNRFVELHFDEIPPSELEMILHMRCEVPLSYSKKMISVLQELQKMRRGSNLFRGKHSFITLRDLFRWAERYRLAPKQESKFYDWDQHLADEGYLVLAGRVRAEEECGDIIKVIEKKMKKKVLTKDLFTLTESTSSVTRPFLEQMSTVKGFEHVVWTQDMRRLYVLVAKSLAFGEPVLLVGETGCGKTTVCQMIAARKQQELYTVNCHMHTEGADFIGGLRPVRSHEDDERLFEWVDGPLILSMKGGGMFLADEISLADDSVLERLNSVLEPERMLVLAEKGTEEGLFSSPEIIYAEEAFRLIGTMNPGGDYGKKELSPALRNRFTEIWCPKVDIGHVSADVISIIEHNIRKGLTLQKEDDTSGFGKAMLQFLEHFTRIELGRKCIISIRDILSWVYFINKVTDAPAYLDPGLAYIHGACLILLDGLGSGLTGSSMLGWKELREASLNYLCQQVWQKSGQKPDRTTLQNRSVSGLQLMNTEDKFGITPFYIKPGSQKDVHIGMFNFEAPQTCINLLRVLRGLQLPRPILLEGSPGVGKTSLVMALAKASGNKITRINLSEQTDVSDLFGADLPIEGGKGGQFAWHNGPLLQALRDGAWVVLDELNLASQSVLEGLNACFDHRGEIYVPELGKSFQVEHHTTKIFACQNPQHQGGARKGLPKSFLNRFTQVHIEPLSSNDLEFILQTMHSSVPQEIVKKMVQFNEVLSREILVEGSWGHRGGPWELNLRDLFRWCDVMVKHQLPEQYNPGEYVGLIYSDRMRTVEDKQKVFAVYERIFGDVFPSYKSVGRFNITDTMLQVGHSFIERKLNGKDSEEDSSGDLYMIHHQLPVVESLITCVNMNWMSLLVGDSGVGKTSVVKLLASILNKRLLTFTVNSEMDVTELLGGFQQVDFGRELGEAVSDASSCVWTSLRELLLAGNFSKSGKLLNIWDTLLAVHNNKTVRTTSEELSHFKHQCEILTSLLDALVPEKHDGIDDISSYVGEMNVGVNGHETPLQKKKKKRKSKSSPQPVNGFEERKNILEPVQKLRNFVIQLQDRVQAAGLVSGGGTFHWVDSILVKAVQNGDWLLIDGVNVCSASVLDRLNAMLEPGGVLAISERGVVDGGVRCITPHADFRLFLVMDPQYGEISRAMRNRGVEICPIGSWATSLDIRSLLHQSELHSPKLQNVLVSVHQAIKEALPVYENLSVSHLKRVAAVANHLVHAGYQDDVALTKAAMLIYVRSQGKADVREALSKIVTNIMTALETMPTVYWPCFETQVLSMRSLRHGSGIARIRLVGSLFESYLLNIEHPDSSKEWMESVLPTPFPVPSHHFGMIQCLTLLLASIPSEDWPLLHSWIVQIVRDVSPEIIPVGHLATSAIQHVISTKPKELLNAVSQNLTESHSCDPRYNIQALAHERNCVAEDVENLSNKAGVWIWRTLIDFYKEAYLKSECVEDSSKVDSMTLLKISRAVAEGKVSKNAALHQSVPYLAPVIEHLHEMIVSLSSNTRISLTNEEWGRLVAALRWTDRFFEVCNQVIKKSVLHLFIPQLALHWQWVVEELLSKMPSSWNELVSPALRKLVNSVQAIFDRQFGPLDKLAVGIRSLTSPAPFTSSLSSEAHCRLVNIASALSPIPSNFKVNVFLASLEGREICQKLMQLATEVGSQNAGTITAMDDSLSLLERKLQKKCFNKDYSTDGFKAGILSLLIQTWPLHDYIALRTLMSDKGYGAISLHHQDVISRAPGIYKEYVAYLSGPSFRQFSVNSVHNYLAFRKSSASRNTQFYLDYSYETEKEEIEEQVNKLKDEFVHPASCQLSYILLGSKSKLNNKSGNIIDEVVAGTHTEKIGQLRSVQSTLWYNWSCLSNPELSYEASFTRSAAAYLTTVLGSLASATGMAPELNIGVYDVSTAANLAYQLASADQVCLSESSKIQLHEVGRLAMELVNCTGSFEEKSAIAANMTLVLGLFQTTYIGCMEPVDPAKRSSLLLQYHQDELQDLESQLTFMNWLDHLRGGVASASQSLCHPHLPIVMARCGLLRDEIIQLNKQLAIRPDPPTYHLLLQDFEHFVSSVFLPEKIQALISSLYCQKEFVGITSDVLGKVGRMIHSCDSFVEKVVQQYPLYRDLTYPLLQAVTLICQALLLTVSAAKRKAFTPQVGVHFGKSLANYSAFPPLRPPQNPLAFLSERSHILKSASALLPEEKYPGQLKSLQNIVLQASILDLINVIHPHKYFNSTTVKLTLELFGQVASIWQKQEEEKALRAEEEENLFKYKARTLAASETEDEQQEREFKETFPTYYKEFEDLDHDILNDPKEEDEIVETEKDVVGNLTDEQMYEMSEFHKIIFTTQISNSWLSTSDKIQVPSQLTKAAVLRLQALKTVVGNVGAIADNSLDHATIGAHILNNHAACAVLTNNPMPSILNLVYDIYRDANPQEALKVRPLLTPVYERVNELLLQWPDHPSLLTINVVIMRVLAFPLTSPLMRHVVGLETLLERAQEWERNAHSRVSLFELLQPVTRQIIEWRKFELQAWRSCLDAVAQKVSIQGRKWWPYLFTTIHNGLAYTVSVEEVGTTLKKFFETSHLGDFQTRLDLVYTFHCHLTVLDKTKVRDKLLALTWNYYNYYNQFLPIVTSNLAKARAPIEKEVKSYVKIARWNDINFFSVRESVIKSQRILHRHMRTWEKTLRGPVTSLLSDAMSDLTQDQNGVWDKEHQQNVSSLISPKLPNLHDDLVSFSHLTDKIILKKLASFTSRFHSITTQVLSKNSYSSNIESVEEFVVNLITNYQDLQTAATKAENLTEKEERMQQLRNVMQRRRDSLAHLFKYLSSLGVSYTMGNSLWQEGDIDKCFEAKPFDINTSHSDVPTMKSACDAWPGCVKYLNRCIARHSLLLTSLQKAHKDLKPEAIKRLQGTTNHLFILVREQYMSLPTLSDLTQELRLLLNDINAVGLQPPPASSMLSHWEQLHTLNTTLNLHVKEVCILLNTTESCSSPLILMQESPEVPEEMNVIEAKSILEEVAKSLPAFVQKYADYVKYFGVDARLATPIYMKRLRGAVRKTEEYTENMKKVISLLSVGQNKEFPVTVPLSEWVMEWESREGELSAFVEKYLVEDIEEESSEWQVSKTSVKKLESCLTCVLLAVENIYKRHKSGDNENDDDEEEEGNSEEKMIAKGLKKDLDSDKDDLHLKQVVTGLKKLLKVSESEPKLLKMLKASLPLLKQYLILTETILVFMVNSNRSLAKCTSVLQAIFQQLALKGFCRPQELEDEAKGEGGMNFEDSDGTGLGEGEGKKDKSDKMESEDQLESALQEGEQDEPGDQDLKEEEKGVEMSGDFEGKMQDVERQEGGDEDSDEEEEEDFEKQMGETEKGAEQLDKKLWGDEENEDDGDNDEDKEMEEEDGEGDGEEVDSKMVAKDDNRSKKEKDKERKEKDKQEEMEDTRKENQMADDGVEYNDDYTDPYAGEEQNPNEGEEEADMNLDDEMKLDDGDGDGKDEEEGEEEDPFGIPEKGVFPEEEREPKENEDEEGEEGETELSTKETTDKEDPDKDDAGNEEEEERGGGGGEGEEKGQQDEEEGDKTDDVQDNRKVGTEEVNEDLEQKQAEEMAEASEDKESKSKEAEAAEMDTTEGSKDETKDMPKTDTGGQREEDKEEKQDEQGQVGEETEEQEGIGESDSKTRDESHKGESSALVTETSASDQADMEKPRKPGETDEDRTLGDNEKSIQRGLMTKQKHKSENQKEKEGENKEGEDKDEKKNSTYEHVSKADDHMDAQMVDASTQEQAQEAPAPADRQEEENVDDEEMMETPMEVDEEEVGNAEAEKEAVKQSGEKNDETGRDEGLDPQGEGDMYMETEGDIVLEATVERPPETYFHTLLPKDEEDEEIAEFDENVEGTRRQIEVAKSQNAEEHSASWSQQESRVAPMALQLCEQLRLILEPTQSSRLKGDYRTGKRLNMRKVIPYIASEFRKDKIWLRRTQPSKRTYQILVAVDDSESMVDMNAGNLAIESIALVTRALTLLEVGEVGVISFGSSTRILHPLDQPFSEAAGSQVLSNLKFDQKVTDFARLLEDSVALLSCSRRSSSHGNPDTAQLLLILSDGQTHTRSKAVKAAVRAARANRIFVVFLVLDARDNKYSFYDVLVYDNGQMTNLVDSFPFPFFLVVRDINTLPDSLCTALRQWFELVTADSGH